MIRILAGPGGRLAALGLLLAGINLGALALHVPADSVADPPARRPAPTPSSAWSRSVSPSTSSPCDLVLRERLPRADVWMILGLAVAMRAALLPAPPFLSSDIYRYVWDGQVQAAGINPYRYIPADPALEPLRDPAIYPLINRKDYAHTIYPPAAQAVFAAVGQVSRSVTGMKLAMLGFEALGVLRCSHPTQRRPAAGAHPDLRLEHRSPCGPSHATGTSTRGGRLPRAGAARAHPPPRRTRGRPPGCGDAGEGAAPRGRPRLRARRPAVAARARRNRRHSRPLPALSRRRPGRARLCRVLRGEEGYDTGAGYWLLAGLGHLGLSPPAYCARTSCAPAWCSPPSRSGSPSAGTGLLRPTPSPCAATPGSWRRWRPARRARTTPGTTLADAARGRRAASGGDLARAAPLLLLIDPFDDRFVWPALVFVPGLVLAARSRRGRPAGRARPPSFPKEPLDDRLRAPEGSASLLRGDRRCAYSGGRRAAGLPLPGGHEPLQPPVRDLPAHLRDPGTPGRHELGAVHPDRRPGAERRPGRAPRRRRADAGAGAAAHDPLPEGPRHLRPVQHQRHTAAGEAIRDADRDRLDELRVSLDAADRASYLRVRGKDFFDRIVRDVGQFVAYQKATGATTPRVSLWLTGLEETWNSCPPSCGCRRDGRDRGASPAPGLR